MNPDSSGNVQLNNYCEISNENNNNNNIKKNNNNNNNIKNECTECKDGSMETSPLEWRQEEKSSQNLFYEQKGSQFDLKEEKLKREISHEDYKRERECSSSSFFKFKKKKMDETDSSDCETDISDTGNSFFHNNNDETPIEQNNNNINLINNMDNNNNNTIINNNINYNTEIINTDELTNNNNDLNLKSTNDQFNNNESIFPHAQSVHSVTLQTCTCQDCLSVNKHYLPKVHISRVGAFATVKGAIHSSYIVKGKLGQGTWGTVHLAVERASGFERAIKKIPKRFGSKDMPRFRQEMTLIKGFDHPRIARVYETYEDHANLYMIMEYLKGGELFDRIADEGYMPEMVAAHLIKQILSAVSYCHTKGVCHRDLKPENFLFAEYDIRSPLKLVDFGLAKRVTETEEMKTVAGSVYYVAPEVLRGSYTRACDVWSCGVILHILISGVPPFVGQTHAHVSNQILNGHIAFGEPVWSKVSSAAKDFIRKLCRMNPTRRQTAREALHHEWLYRMCPSPLVHLCKCPMGTSWPEDNLDCLETTTPLSSTLSLPRSSRSGGHLCAPSSVAPFSSHSPRGLDNNNNYNRNTVHRFSSDGAKITEREPTTQVEDFLDDFLDSIREKLSDGNLDSPSRPVLTRHPKNDSEKINDNINILSNQSGTESSGGQNERSPSVTKKIGHPFLSDRFCCDIFAISISHHSNKCKKILKCRHPIFRRPGGAESSVDLESGDDDFQDQINDTDSMHATETVKNSSIVARDQNHSSNYSSIDRKGDLTPLDSQSDFNNNKIKNSNSDSNPHLQSSSGSSVFDHQSDFNNNINNQIQMDSQFINERKATQRALRRLGIKTADNAVDLAQKLLKKFRHFARMCPLKRAILNVIAQQLEHTNELNYIRALFDLLDLDGDGVMTKDEFQRSLLILFNMPNPVLKKEGEDEDHLDSNQIFDTDSYFQLLSQNNNSDNKLKNNNNLSNRLFVHLNQKNNSTTTSSSVSLLLNNLNNNNINNNNLKCPSNLQSPRDSDSMNTQMSNSNLSSSGRESISQTVESTTAVNVDFRLAERISAEILHLADYIDLDGNNQIEYSEFVAACLDKSSYTKSAACRAAFRVFDRDGDGKIGKPELRSVFGWSPKIDSPLSPTESIRPNVIGMSASAVNISSSGANSSLNERIGARKSEDYNGSNIIMGEKNKKKEFRITSLSPVIAGPYYHDDKFENENYNFRNKIIKMNDNNIADTDLQTSPSCHRKSIPEDIEWSCCHQSLLCASYSTNQILNKNDKIIIENKNKNNEPMSHTVSSSSLSIEFMNRKKKENSEDDFLKLNLKDDGEFILSRENSSGEESVKSVSGSSRNMDAELKEISMDDGLEYEIQRALSAADVDNDGFIGVQDFESLLNQDVAPIVTMSTAGSLLELQINIPKYEIDNYGDQINVNLISRDNEYLNSESQDSSSSQSQMVIIPLQQTRQLANDNVPNRRRVLTDLEDSKLYDATMFEIGDKDDRKADEDVFDFGLSLSSPSFALRNSHRPSECDSNQFDRRTLDEMRINETERIRAMIREQVRREYLAEHR